MSNISKKLNFGEYMYEIYDAKTVDYDWVCTNK